MLANGKVDAGIRSLEALHGAAIAGYPLAAAYVQQGRYKEAADTLLDAPAYQPFRPLRDGAAEALRVLARRGTLTGTLPTFDEEFGFVYAALGEPERLLDWPERAMQNGDYRPIGYLWWPTPPSVRRTERFKMLTEMLVGRILALTWLARFVPSRWRSRLRLYVTRLGIAASIVR